MRIEQNSGNLFSFCSWISIRDTSIIGLSMIELSHRNLSLIWKQSTLTTIHSPVHILIQTITTTKQETVWRWVGPVDWTKTINAYKCYYWWTTLTKSLEFDRHIFHLIGFSHFYLYIYIYIWRVSIIWQPGHNGRGNFDGYGCSNSCCPMQEWCHWIQRGRPVGEWPGIVKGKPSGQWKSRSVMQTLDFILQGFYWGIKTVGKSN